MKTSVMAVLFLFRQAQGHGFLMEPKSRNWYAYTDGQNCEEWCACAGHGNCEDVPRKEYNYPSINQNEKDGAFLACGTDQDLKAFNYDNPENAAGGNLNWKTQAVYSTGQEIDVDVVLTAHHEGYFEFFICEETHAPTKACFDKHPLEFVQDRLYGAVKLKSFPTRAHVPPERYGSYNHNGGGKIHQYRMKLPTGVSGNVLLQWRYTTGNSCYPDAGYADYVQNYYVQANGWPASLYLSLPLCYPNPLPEAASASPAERFWNCAEVNIGGINAGGIFDHIYDTPTPPVAAPTITPPPTGSTGSVGGACCSGGVTGNYAANNCDGYVACVDGTNFGYVVCPSGLKFAESSGYCDWPENVDCDSTCQA